MMLSKVKI